MDDAPLLFREPIVNRHREPVGYDFSLISPAGERAPVGGLAGLLHGTKESEDYFQRVGGRFAMADCGQVEADRPQAASGRFVLSLRPDEGIDNVAALAVKWRTAAFGLCLDVPAAATWPQPVLKQASHLRFDCARPQQAEEAQGRLRNQEAKQIAGGIRSFAAFERAREAGFDMFQGYFFLAPGSASGPSSSASYSSIVTLMKLAQQDAPIGKIEEVLKRDAPLSYRLLRYINSAGFGLSCEIQSFRQAVTLLGYQNLHKWLALLMVTAARQNTLAALVTTAVARGRAAELLGRELFDAQSRDNLFMTGAFSLLHVILQMPLEKIAEQITLGEAITEALFHRAGPYGPLLELIELSEQLDEPANAERAADLTMSLGLTHQALNRALMDALIWAEGLGR